MRLIYSNVGRAVVAALLLVQVLLGVAGVFPVVAAAVLAERLVSGHLVALAEL